MATRFDISVVYVLSEHNLVSEEYTQMVISFNDGEGAGQSTMCLHEMLTDSLKRQVGVTWELIVVDAWFFTRHLVWDNYFFLQGIPAWKAVSLAPIYCNAKSDAKARFTPERAKNTGLLLVRGRLVVFLENEAILWHPWVLEGHSRAKSGQDGVFLLEDLVSKGGFGPDGGFWEREFAIAKEREKVLEYFGEKNGVIRWMF